MPIALKIDGVNGADFEGQNAKNIAELDAATIGTNLREAIQDLIASFAVAGTNVTLTYNDVANTFTIAASGGLSLEEVQDAVAAMLSGTGINVTYNDPAGTIALALDTETVQDTVAAMFAGAHTNATVTYNDGAGTLTIAVTATNTLSGARALPSSSGSLPNAAYTTIALASEEYDTDAYHSTSVNTGRLTIPSGKAGYGRFTASLDINGNATGVRGLRILKNGSAVVGRVAQSANATLNILNLVTDPLPIIVGDYFEMQGYQDSGAGLGYDSIDTTFSIKYEGA